MSTTRYRRTRGAPGMRARFQAVCPRCSRDVLVGDRVIPRRGTYLHVGCASGQDDE